MIVTLKTELSQSTVQVGDTVTATVSATVTGGTATDGIVAYNIDVLPLDKLGIDFVGFAVQDPTSSLSAGTFDSGTGGLLGISGLYDSPGVGIGSSITLFTFQVHADAVGSNSVSAGLSVFPNGTGVPFILNDSGDFTPPGGNVSPPFLVDTSNAVAPLTVLPASVPEPASGLLLAGVLAMAATRKWRRRR